MRGAVDECVHVQPLSLSVYIIRAMDGPIVFIGSSREHLTTARALAECLRGSTRVTVWDEAPFALNDSIFDGLLKEADRADYAIFVFDDDDVTRIRGLEVRTVRDNVLFEFGLFVGRMGKRRTFWISARDSQGHHIPTDLLGITHLTFTRPLSKPFHALVQAMQEPAERIMRVISKEGRRTDRALDELDTVRALCVASSGYEKPQFEKDIRLIREKFPRGSVTSDHGVTGAKLYSLFSKHTWDIVHLAMYVDPTHGHLLLSERGAQDIGPQSIIPVEGVDKLIAMAQPRLVVVVTCDSLVLAVRLARHTNTIAGHKRINVQQALDWSKVFYPALADGCPLSESFNRAQAIADPGLMLLSKRDFRLNLKSSRGTPQRRSKSLRAR